MVWTLQTVGIIGAGYLGSRIAAECSLNGILVRIFDPKLNEEHTRSVIRQSFGECLDVLPMPHEQVIAAAMSRISVHHSIAETVRDCDLVSEAVTDTLDIKLSVLSEVEANYNAEKCIFTTNTMTIPLESLQKASLHPERVLSLRWLAPVLYIPFLELAMAEHDDRQKALTMELVSEFSRRLDKIVFVCPMNIWNSTTGEIDGWSRLRLFNSQVTQHQKTHSSRRNPLIATMSGLESTTVYESQVQIECLLCVAKKADALLIECGHVVMCQDCARVNRMHSKSCPICRIESLKAPLKMISPEQPPKL